MNSAHEVVTGCIPIKRNAWHLLSHTERASQRMKLLLRLLSSSSLSFRRSYSIKAHPARTPCERQCFISSSPSNDVKEIRLTLPSIRTLVHRNAAVCPAQPYPTSAVSEGGEMFCLRCISSNQETSKLFSRRHGKYGMQIKSSHSQIAAHIGLMRICIHVED